MSINLGQKFLFFEGNKIAQKIPFHVKNLNSNSSTLKVE